LMSGSGSMGADFRCRTLATYVELRPILTLVP